jgi:predicted Zn-dependent protease with MMP-like domain
MGAEDKTCEDCGLSPIPALETVYKGRQIVCRACAYAAPKRITMWRHAPGQVWWNNASGGEPVEYIRADLVPAELQPPRG